jgi:hypothetical protein
MQCLSRNHLQSSGGTGRIAYVISLPLPTYNLPFVIKRFRNQPPAPPCCPTVAFPTGRTGRRRLYDSDKEPQTAGRPGAGTFGLASALTNDLNDPPVTRPQHDHTILDIQVRPVFYSSFMFQVQGTELGLTEKTPSSRLARPIMIAVTDMALISHHMMHPPSERAPP